MIVELRNPKAGTDYRATLQPVRDIMFAWHRLDGRTRAIAPAKDVCSLPEFLPARQVSAPEAIYALANAGLVTDTEAPNV